MYDWFMPVLFSMNEGFSSFMCNIWMYICQADAVQHNLVIAPSRIDGAGLGLFVSGDVAPESTVVEYTGTWYTAQALSLLSPTTTLPGRGE